MPCVEIDRDAYMARFDLRRRWIRRLGLLLRRAGLLREPLQQFVYDRLFLKDAEVVTFAYAKTNDHLPNLDHPTWYNEKIRWLFLNHPNPLMSLVADKVAVRDYLAFRGARIKPPALIAFGTESADLATVELPEEFVLKSTFGSGQNHIELAWMKTPRAALVKLCAGWSEYDQWRNTGELHYRGIPKRWLVEEYVSSRQGQVEYKIFCMMGEPVFILVITERNGPKNYKRMLYDTQWNPVHFHWQVSPPIDENPVPRPVALEEMLADARLLAADFLQVRVDFLNCDDRTVFSELTFASAAARIPFTPVEANIEMGNLIDLDQAEEYLAHGQQVVAEIQARGKLAPSTKAGSTTSASEPPRPASRTRDRSKGSQARAGCVEAKGIGVEDGGSREQFSRVDMAG